MIDIILTEDTCFIVDPFGKIIKTIGKFLEMATFGFTLIELLLYHALHAFTHTSSLPSKSHLRLQKESKSTMLCPCEKEIVAKREMLHSSDIMHC